MIHRLLIGCPCGAQFSLPMDGHSYQVCPGCSLTVENNYREDGGRRLEIHPPHVWKRIQEGRRG
jgi:hypothetical protein